MLEILFLFSIDSLGADSFHYTWHVHCNKFISMFIYKWFFFMAYNLILMHAYKNDEGTKITESRTKSIHLTGEIVYEMNKMIACQILGILHLLRFYYIPVPSKSWLLSSSTREIWFSLPCHHFYSTNNLLLSFNLHLEIPKNLIFFPQKTYK